MLTTPDNLLFLRLLRDDIHKELLHHLSRDRGEAGQPVVPWVLLLALFEGWSTTVCSNSNILNESDAKTENSACLLIYDIIVIAQRCFLFILIVFSILVTESWAGYTPRQSQRMLQVRNLWTKSLFLAAISVKIIFQPTQLATKTTTTLHLIKYLLLFLKDTTGSHNNSKSFLRSSFTPHWNCPGHPLSAL